MEDMRKLREEYDTLAKEYSDLLKAKIGLEEALV